MGPQASAACGTCVGMHGAGMQMCGGLFDGRDRDTRGHLRPPRHSSSMVAKHWCLLPHEVLWQLHQQGGEIWQSGIVGPDGASAFERFWQAEFDCTPEDPIFNHPDAEGQFKLHVPIGLHGDDVRDLKDCKVLVLTWNSVLSRASSIDSRWVFSIIAHRQLLPRSTMFQLLDLLVWSLQWARRGIFPTVDHKGRPWLAGSWRAAMSGQPIAGATVEASYKLAFVQLRGDCEFLERAMKWQHYRNVELCHRCWCNSVSPMPQGLAPAASAASWRAGGGSPRSPLAPAAR